MGVLNVTPDSFSDGGAFVTQARALRHAERMVAEGVDIIDIGGESTRPGAPEVSVDTELKRVLPIIEVLRRELEIPISIDTSKPQVMQAALEAGAAMINDVRALQAPGALEAVANSDVPVCLMHMQGNPRTMQTEPQYGNVVEDIIGFLTTRVNVCRLAGIADERIVVDPGFGFGKTVAQNYALLKSLPELVALGYPVLVGVSRKSMIGQVLKVPIETRDPASAVLAGFAVERGAQILRVHNVALTRQAIDLALALIRGIE